MPRREKYVPKHRNAPLEPTVELEPTAKKGIRKSALVSGVAVIATGIAVGGSTLAAKGEAPGDTATSTIEKAKAERQGQLATADVIRDRESESTSRSERRTSAADARREAEAKKAAEAKRAADARNAAEAKRRAEAKAAAAAKAERIAAQDPREIAQRLMPQYGFSSSEFSCLDALYVSESDWDMHADNPTSSAYGIPQALTEMYDLPADYRTNPVSQIEWGLWYIRDSYGTPCSAWEFKQANDWY